MDIEKELEQLKQAHKWTIVTCGCVLVLILAILLRLPKDDADIYKAQMQAIKDSIAVRDARYEQQLETFQVQRSSDSMRTMTIHSDLLRTMDMIVDIKHKYDIQRSHINNLPVDEQIGYFSNWVSTADSL